MSASFTSAQVRDGLIDLLRVQSHEHVTLADLGTVGNDRFDDKRVPFLGLDEEFLSRLCLKHAIQIDGDPQRTFLDRVAGRRRSLHRFGGLGRRMAYLGIAACRGFVGRLRTHLGAFYGGLGVCRRFDLGNRSLAFRGRVHARDQASVPYQQGGRDKPVAQVRGHVLFSRCNGDLALAAPAGEFRRTLVRLVF